MSENPTYYDLTLPACKELIGDGRRLLANYNYSELMTQAYNPGRYQELLHIFGVSAALSLIIQSYCPPTVSKSWFLSGPLTRKICGRGVPDRKLPAIAIIWTQTVVPESIREFKPNHFSILRPLCDNNAANASRLIDLVGCEEIEDSLLSDLASASPHRDNVDESIPANSTHTSDNQSHPHMNDISSSSTAIPDSVTNLNTSANQSISVNDSADQSMSVNDSSEDFSDNESPIPAVGGQALLQPKFKPVGELLAALMDSTSQPLAHIPRGTKDNVSKMNAGKSSDFWDDCGAWEPNGGSPKTLFLCGENKSFTNIFDKRKQGLGYCLSKQVNKKSCVCAP